MGLIFRQVAQITPLDAPANTATAMQPATALLQEEEGPSTPASSSATAASRLG